MVLLNLSTPLKSLPFGLGRRNKKGSSDGGSSGSASPLTPSPAVSPRRHGTTSDENDVTNQAVVENPKCASRKTSNADDAWLNYYKLFANMKIDDTSSLGELADPKTRSQTLPVTLGKRTPCYKIENEKGERLPAMIVQDCSNFDEDVFPSRKRRSMSTSYERIQLRRRLNMNPSWKASNVS